MYKLYVLCRTVHKCVLTYVCVHMSVHFNGFIIDQHFKCVRMHICATFLHALYTAAPDQVPGVMVIDDSISLDDDIVTLTLSWGQTFNNFDPIVSYTVSCLGDDACPPNFTTIDNTTTTFDITNLTSMTNYTFSVVATNSIGSGEAGVVMITTPSCE